MEILQQILSTLTALVMALSAQIVSLPPITQLAQVSAPSSGLVGYWNFDEGSGTVANDSSGNGNTGTINGATWTTGKVGSGALSFDGTSSYVSLGSSASLSGITYPYSISLWFKSSTNQSKILFSFDTNDASSDQAILLANSSGGNNQWIIAGNKYANVYPTINNLSDGQWHNVVVERDSSNNALIYVDGNNFSTNNTSAYSVSNMVIGGRGAGTYPFNGSIDEIRIYNRTLSASEVSNIYNEGGSSVMPPAPEPEPTPAPTPTPTPINGSCGSSVNTCTTGTLSDTADTSTNYLWICQGSNGGTNVSCSLPISITPPPSNGTYTVKKDGTGNFTTIQACADAVTAGGTCLVYAGTYNERVSTKSGGTSDSNRIFFKTQGTVTMQGFDIKNPYITIEGFDMTGYSVNYTGYVDVWQNGDYVNVLNNTIRDVDGGAKVNGVKFERVSGDSANNGIVRGNTMTHLNSQYFSLHGSNHLIEQNRMTEARQWDPFMVFGTNHIIRHNIFLNAGTAGGGNHPDYFQTWGASGEPAQNILFEDNWMQDLPEQLCQLNSSVDGVGALVTNVRDFTFRRNVVVNVPANCNVDIPGTRWENNTFSRMSYNMTGFIMGGSLTRGDGSSAVFRNNVFLEGGSNPTASNSSSGFYSVDGFLFTREVIAQYVTGEGFASCASPGCPIANGITNDMIASGYIDGAYNGHILPAARALTSGDAMNLNASYAAYKPALWTKLQESITYDNTLKSTFSADYNYVAGATSSGYPAKKSSGCVAGATYTSGNFCEPHGINGGDPKLQNVSNPIGPDGIPFTSDDGLRPLSGSPLCGTGEGGASIGAYSCSSSSLGAPTISNFYATPSSITSGNSTILSWSVSGASSISIDNNVGSVTNLTSKTVSPNVTTTYTITATNSAGSVTRSITVSVSSASISDLVLRLNFEGYTPSSGIVSDKSGTGNDGACNYSLGQCPVIGTGPDNSTAARFFGAYPDAANDGNYVSVSKTSSLSNLTSGTVSVWARYANISPDRVEFILDSYQKTGENPDHSDIGTPGTWYIGRNYYQNNSLWAFNNSGSRVQLISFPDSSVYTQQQSGTAGWHQYAFTWDGTNVKGYYDGALISTTPQTNFSYFTLGNYLALGASGHNSLPETGTQKYPNHGFINGYLDEIRIYNRALSSAEISSLYSAPANNTAPTTQPITPEPTLPVISNLVGSNTTSNSTKISWDTNIATNGQVFYGKTSSYGLSSVLVDNSPKTTSHSVTLSNLSAATAYHFKVTSIDASSNSISSSDFTFTTQASAPQSVSSNTTASGAGSSGSSSNSITTPTATTPAPIVYIPPALPAAVSTQISGPTLTRNLLPSNKGEEVKILQNFLISQGLLSADSNTGYFGPATQKAVQDFQKARGLVSSGDFWTTGYGMVGPATRAMINSITGSATVNTSTTNTTATVPLVRNLSRGSEGSDVTILQNFLISQGYLAPGNAIGYFGPLTETAIKKFQASQNIVSAGTPQTTGYGNVGSMTRAKINAFLGANNLPIGTSNTTLQAQIQALQQQVQELMLKLQKAQ